MVADSTVIEPPKDPCEEDTLSPWVYPDPSGGLHYGEVSVLFLSTKPCKIEWKFKNGTNWNIYNDSGVTVDKNTTLCFKAVDSCGNRMELRYEKYEIKPMKEKLYCPNNMEFIKIGDAQFCIDQYEWPNKVGKRPTSNISIYNAMDSCFTVGKRLCTTDEWSLACGGVYSWKYPYGDTYEPNACITRDTSVQVAGTKPECRGYFGIFDMAGNLAEWTNTKSKINNEYYNVMGGFWESGPQSSCFEPRYSYYPRNSHNPVGFRCCKDINKR